MSSGPKEADDSAFVHLLAALARQSDRAPEAEAPPLPDRFGPYRVVGVLGRGAMGSSIGRWTRPRGATLQSRPWRGPTRACFPPSARRSPFSSTSATRASSRCSRTASSTAIPWYAMELLAGRTLEQFNGVVWQGIRRTDWRSNPGSSLDQPLQGGVADAPAAGGRLAGPRSLRADLRAARVHSRRGHRRLRSEARERVRARRRPTRPPGFRPAVAGRRCDRPRDPRGRRSPSWHVALSFAPELITPPNPGRKSRPLCARVYPVRELHRPDTVRRNDRPGLLGGAVHAEPPFARSIRRERCPCGRLDRCLTSLLAGSRPNRRHRRRGRRGGAPLGSPRGRWDRRRHGRTSSQPLSPPAHRGPRGRIERPRGLGPGGGGEGRHFVLGGGGGIGKTFLRRRRLAQRGRAYGLVGVTGECMPVAANRTRAAERWSAPPSSSFRALLRARATGCRDTSHRGTRTLGPGGQSRFSRLRAALRVSRRYAGRGRRIADARLRLARSANACSTPCPISSSGRARASAAARDRRDLPIGAGPLSLAFLHFSLMASGPERRLMVSRCGSKAEGATGSRSSRRRMASCLSHSIELERRRVEGPGRRPPRRSAVPTRSFERLKVHSEGNPFFVAEYLRAGATEGLLRRTAEGGWRLAQSGGALDYDALTLPASLQALLERRLSALRVDTQRLTEAAAVLGRECPLAMLSPIAGIAPENVPAAVAEMFARQVAQGVPAKPSASCTTSSGKRPPAASTGRDVRLCTSPPRTSSSGRTTDRPGCPPTTPRARVSPAPGRAGIAGARLFREGGSACPSRVG